MSSVHLSDSELGGPFFFLPLLAMGPGSFEHAHRLRFSHASLFAAPPQVLFGFVPVLV